MTSRLYNSEVNKSLPSWNLHPNKGEDVGHNNFGVKYKKSLKDVKLSSDKISFMC